MRPGIVLLASSLVLLPSVAAASPFARVHALQTPTGTTTTTTVTTTTAPTPNAPRPNAPTPNDPSLQPTSSKAPASKDLPEPAPEPTPAPVVETPPPEEPEVPPPPAPEKWNRHGIGIRGGITVIPTFAVRNYVQSLTNSMCRGNSIPSGALGDKLTRVDGCNFYIGLEYIYRQSKNLDIVPAVTYSKIKAPDGLWLDDSETDPITGKPNLGVADYTQVNFSHVALQVDFIGRGTLIKTPDFAWQLGGGGGIGLGIITGFGFLQTPLGNKVGGQPGSPDGQTCNSIADYGDFTKCTPHYQGPEDDNNGGPPPPQGSLQLDQSGDNMSNPLRFAKCNANGCSGDDLDALGRKKGINLPVIPIVNILVTTRFMIKDTFGINITGGWQTGFYFGGSLQYFFGPK